MQLRRQTLVLLQLSRGFQMSLRGYLQCLQVARFQHLHNYRVPGRKQGLTACSKCCRSSTLCGWLILQNLRFLVSAWGAEILLVFLISQYTSGDGIITGQYWLDFAHQQPINNYVRCFMNVVPGPTKSHEKRALLPCMIRRPSASSLPTTTKTTTTRKINNNNTHITLILFPSPVDAEIRLIRTCLSCWPDSYLYMFVYGYQCVTPRCVHYTRHINSLVTPHCILAMW